MYINIHLHTQAYIYIRSTYSKDMYLLFATVLNFAAFAVEDTEVYGDL